MQTTSPPDPKEDKKARDTPLKAESDIPLVDPATLAETDNRYGNAGKHHRDAKHPGDGQLQTSHPRCIWIATVISCF